MEPPNQKWYFVTGEYPPDRGGVSDYTHIVAEAIVHSGGTVIVLAPLHENRTIQSAKTSPDQKSDEGDCERLTVMRLKRPFSLFGFGRMNWILGASNCRRKILIQYTPLAFGYRSLNVFLPFWMLWRRWWCRDWIGIMFHEFAYPLVRRPMRHNVLAITHRIMAFVMLRAANEVYSSTEAWEKYIDRYGPNRTRTKTLGIVSSIPRSELPKGERNSGEAPRLGHFSGFGSLMVVILKPILSALLSRHKSLEISLIGNGFKLRDELTAENADWAKRIRVTGYLESKQVAEELVACDAVLQPYADGLNKRRTSALAALANGTAVISNRGHNTEAIWDENCVSFGIVNDPNESASNILALLDDQRRLNRIATEGQRLYSRQFAIERTLKILLETKPD